MNSFNTNLIYYMNEYISFINENYLMTAFKYYTDFVMRILYQIIII